MAEKEKKGIETKIIQRQHEEEHDEEGEEELSLLHVDELVIEAILLRLPAKSLTRFKCVSKLFFSLITDPTFAAKHRSLKRPGCSLLVMPPSPSGYYESPHAWDRRFLMIDTKMPPKSRASILDPTDLPYTVNAATNVIDGLICFYNREKFHGPFYLYNITTREKLQISPPYLDAQCDWFNQEVHLCFDPTNEEYKLLRLWSSSSTFRCEVLTLWTNEQKLWRRINIPWESFRYNKQWFGFGSSICLDSFLYSIVSYKTRGNSYFNDIVMVFDVEHEKLELIDLPQPKVNYPTLANLRGQLSLVSTPSTYDNSRSRCGDDVEITVWKLLHGKERKNDDDKSLWGTKEVIRCVLEDASNISCSEFGLVSCTMLVPDSDIAIIQGYDLATRKPRKFKINNAQGKLAGYHNSAKEFCPFKMVENIMAFKNYIKKHEN